VISVGFTLTLQLGAVTEEEAQAIYFSHKIRPPESLLTINGQNIPFVPNVKHLGIIFDRKITWGLHIKTIEVKAFRAFIRTHSLFKSEHLSSNIKLTFYKALIRSIMTYGSPAWEFPANTNLLKLQVLHTTGNFPRCTPVRELHKAFNIPYIYDYITKLCRQQAEVIRNHENANVRHIGQGEAQHRKHKRLKLGGGEVYDR
jgi:hypothetical protein